MDRRTFLRTTLPAASVFSIVPRHVLGGPRHVPPSEKITHAVVGVGGMGNGHVSYVLRDRQAKLLAVCDVDEARLARAVARGGKGCRGYGDFRDVLDRGDIDVVHVPTPPHWHALISIAAAEAGCDVWSEKPMTQTIGESLRVVDAVRRNGRMYRINTWFRLHSRLYSSGWYTKTIKKLVSNGLLGWPITVRISPSTGFNWKVRGNCGSTDLKPERVPANLDYDMWLGPAPVKPYNHQRVHGRFRRYWDYEAGGLGDMGQHYIDPVQYILGKDDTNPVEIVPYAPWPQHPDAVGMWGRIEMTYADGCRLILESGEWGDRVTEGKPYFEGPKGKLFIGGRTDPPDLLDALPALPEPAPMVSNFNVSVKERRRFGLNEDTSHRSNVTVRSAVLAIRLGRKLRFDPVEHRFIGDDAANRMLDPPMRSPWHL
ncbi:MAG: Gfo/Idh/MocA family oxidoreductase [Lentisphaerae bacterium]|jgi:myo-inositol 2-dehydrogenase / D-chiro-inositol 1-dehydrogenase|nr:Gfo/Idh/MocA family oxidoreductase [Lentisphaerota bacterium]MBT4819714.1 Gfo/Idh/MocA family oxidoreductase [Lentisphaerota bacterium]MBT5609200.1 Gfo/Idh/MocA family oxidoreductase [Lentisphaerota bacterium]MBT7055189.1 Gfo/Idh/MocA family oxidoreductase [Lentisphaerota bacterium]MBT7847154.1 Gfo/Idh/MocA family oxidoreductase [Lentisphaerota bacterium]